MITRCSRWVCVKKQNSRKNCLIVIESYTSVYTHVNFSCFGFTFKKRHSSYSQVLVVYHMHKTHKVVVHKRHVLMEWGSGNKAYVHGYITIHMHK